MYNTDPSRRKSAGDARIGEDQIGDICGADLSPPCPFQKKETKVVIDGSEIWFHPAGLSWAGIMGHHKGALPHRDLIGGQSG